MDDPEQPYDPVDPQQDCFRPPSIPTMVWCLHCGEEYDSWRMEYRIHTDPDGDRHGFWCCGIEGCDGVGFGMDIHPVDEDYVDPDGREMGRWVEDPPPDPLTDWSRPPDTPTPVRCEKCGREYLSDAMRWWTSDDSDPEAYVERGWLCANETCDGFGFGDDVRPTDPNFVDPHGRQVMRPGEKRPEIRDEDMPF